MAKQKQETKDKVVKPATKRKTTKTKALIKTGSKDVSIETMIMKAINKGQMDIVERLLAVRKQVRDEAAKDAYFQDLARFQRLCPLIPKTVEVKNKPEKGGGIRYRYTPFPKIISAVHELLTECGFSFLIKTKQTKTIFWATVESHHIAGHIESTTFGAPIQEDSYMTSPQKVASAQTFAKRQAFCNAYGIVTEDQDDDANSVNGEVTEARPREKKVEKPKIEGLNSLCDECLEMLKNGVFQEHKEQAESLEKKVTELHKEKNHAALKAMRDSIKRQKLAYAKQQLGG